MEYVLKVKEDKKGKALINHLQSLDFIELQKQEDEIDPKSFRDMIRRAERSKSLSLDEAKTRIAKWSKRKSL